MSRQSTLLTLVFVSCFAVCAHGESTTTLEFVIWEPAPPAPVTSSDVIHVFVHTPEAVFFNSSPTYSSSLVIDGFHIDWDIVSSGGTGGIFMHTPMVHDAYIGPLPTGIYEVAASWTHLGSEGLLLGAPSSGTGTMSFTVVPEPAVAITSLGLFILTVSVRKPRFSR